MGRIPTLIDGDLVLFESAAICLHLADRHPHAALAPRVGSDERAHLYKWLMFLTNTIQPDFMAYRYPEKHTTDGGGIAPVKASAEARMEAAYAVVNDALDRGGPYLLGETISVADFYLLMLVGWSRSQKTPPANLPAIRRCIDLVAARPAVRRAAATERIERLY